MDKVAPHTGAWIETTAASSSYNHHHGSPLTQGRGLKLLKAGTPNSWSSSPLTQGRGLKLASWIAIMPPFRRPSHRGVD